MVKTGDVSEEELNLFQFAATHVAELGAGSAEVMREQDGPTASVRHTSEPRTGEEARSKAAADAWRRLSAGAKVYVQFAEARPQLFDLMFSSLGVGSGQGKTDGTESSDRKAYQQLSDALDHLVLSRRVSPERRAGAESTLWALIHGLTVLRNRRTARTIRRFVGAYAQIYRAWLRYRPR